MQDAAVVLEVLRERGRKGLPLSELYRQIFNPAMYLLAYGRIYSNQGAMTPGACGETADGMSEAMIGEIIELMRFERYRFAPARRVYIPKKNGTLRPLGMPSWRDKLTGEVVRLILEAVYEPVFSSRSHGFRKGTGLPYRAAAGTRRLDRDRVVHRRRHLRLLRIGRSRDPDADTGGEDRGPAVPPAHPRHAAGRVPGGLGVQGHAQRYPARRRGLPGPEQHLPA